MQYVSARQIKVQLAAFNESCIRSVRVEGKLTKIVGLALEASGCKAPIGARFKIVSSNGSTAIAELVGFHDEISYLLPLSYSEGLLPGAKLYAISVQSTIKVSNKLLGRVIDANMNPLDSHELLKAEEEYSLHGKRLNPLQRSSVTVPLDVGIRAINGLLTIGKGQRIGLFAGTGVGKTVLLSMIAKATQADVVVIGLIGERGREVKDFVDKTLSKEALEKSVVVVSPADDPPLLRLQGALTATTIAEYYRDQGNDVLLIMDSLTRFAQAQREIALSIGEPPASRGYPPSVFTKIPRLIERAGAINNGGSITGIYTVLTEGDDLNDPVADSARGILDGHIVLDRSLAEKGIYPAIATEASISRTMVDVIDNDHKIAAAQFKKLYSTYLQNQDIISLGAYKRGSNTEIDYAIEKYPELIDFICQSIDEPCDFSSTQEKLNGIIQH